MARPPRRASNGVFVGNNATGNQILGNYIGADPTGTTALPNSAHGVSMSGTAVGTLIGGLNPGEGNLISGNGLPGFFGAGVVLGQWRVGGHCSWQFHRDRRGRKRRHSEPNGWNIDNQFVNNHTIVENSAAARNVISGNGIGTTFAAGVSIFNAASNNQILGNYIGTNAAGTAILANTSSGVQVLG